MAGFLRKNSQNPLTQHKSRIPWCQLKYLVSWLNEIKGDPESSSDVQIKDQNVEAKKATYPHEHWNVD